MRGDPATRHSVLLVEDNAGDAQLVAVMLAQGPFGLFALTRVSTLAEALTALRGGGYTCVLLDLGLPDADLLDGLRAIRSAHPAMPVVVLTGSDPSVAYDALRCGAQDFLEKGNVDPVLLQRTVRYAVERARVDAALRERDRQLATSHRLARMGTWEWHLDTGVVHASPELRTVLGLSARTASWTAAQAVRLVHEADRPGVLAAIRAALEAPGEFHFTARLLTESAVVTTRHVGEVKRGADGQPTTVFATMQDLTELDRAEAALRRSERRYRTIVETADEGVWAVDANLVTTFANRGLANILGRPIESLVGAHVGTVVAEGSYAALADAIAASQAGERTRRELTLRRADGATVRVQAAMSHIPADDGGRPSVLAVVNDITERYDAEQALRLDHDVVVALTTATDLPGALRSAVARAADTVAAPYAEIWHRPPGGRHVERADVVPGGDGRYQELARLSATVRLLPGEDVIGRVWESGKAVVGAWSDDPLRLGAATGAGLVHAYVLPIRARGTVAVVVWHMTRADVGSRLVDALATVGVRLDGFAARSQVEQMKETFLTALSHELRTPLTAVIGLATTLRDHGARLDAAQRDECLAGVVRNATRLNVLLTDLLDVDRLARGVVDPARRAVQVDDLVRDVAEEFDPGLTRTSLELEPCVADVDAPKVERILENLLSNAAKYTPPAAPIRIRLTARGDSLVIAVDDYGPGVRDDLKSTIFEPFRRGDGPLTHAPGTGIGLSLVAGFARLHGGHAWVEDRPGGGSSFRVSLPLRRPDDDALVPHQRGSTADTLAGAQDG